MGELAIFDCLKTDTAKLSVSTASGNARIRLMSRSFSATCWPCDLAVNCAGNTHFLEMGNCQFGPMEKSMAKNIREFLTVELNAVGIEWSAEQ